MEVCVYDLPDLTQCLSIAGFLTGREKLGREEAINVGLMVGLKLETVIIFRFEL